MFGSGDVVKDIVEDFYEELLGGFHAYIPINLTLNLILYYARMRVTPAVTSQFRYDKNTVSEIYGCQ